MTEEHTDAGNESLRQHIQDDWTHVALVDDEGVANLGGTDDELTVTHDIEQPTEV